MRRILVEEIKEEIKRKKKIEVRNKNSEQGNKKTIRNKK